MEKTLTQELWMRESTEFTMSDGTTVNGFRVVYVRDLNEGESVEDIDEGEEYMEVVGGSIVPNLVDENYDGIDEDEVVDEDVVGNPEFYIGNEGVPID